MMKNGVCQYMMTDDELEEQLKNPRIIRNRLKVFATRKNAIVFLNIQKEFGSFDTYIWQFVVYLWVDSPAVSVAYSPHNRKAEAFHSRSFYADK